MSRAEGESARDSERSEAESLVAFGAEGPGSICHRPQHGDRVRAPRLKRDRFTALCSNNTRVVGQVQGLPKVLRDV